MLQNPVNCFWDVVHNNVQIDFVWLVSLCVEGVLESDDVRMVQFLHDLQFSVLVPLILVYFLDGDNFSRFCNTGLINDTEGAISDNSVRIVGEGSL